MRRLYGVALLAVMLLTLGACGDDDSLCNRLPGTDFRSEEQISAILGPDGVEPSNEYIDFFADEADWLYGDVVEVLEWKCSGNRVELGEGRFEADVLEEGGLLVLDRDGTRYVQD